MRQRKEVSLEEYIITVFFYYLIWVVSIAGGGVLYAEITNALLDRGSFLYLSFFLAVIPNTILIILTFKLED